MRRLPLALTVAGSDSGGGAGIQADLKTFASLGAHGTSAITCLTAQNPKTVTAVHPAPTEFVEAQLAALFAELPPTAAKTGMLFNAGIIRLVADWFAERRDIPLVVDPVMIATSGARLLKPDAMRAMRDRMLPMATVVTPNLDEAAALLGRPLSTLDDLREAARGIHGRWGIAALVKGGHLKTERLATDVFWDGRDEILLKARFVRGVATHGTGCTYSAAITALLARGLPLAKAVSLAKDHVTGAIRHSVRIGGHTALDPFFESR